MGNQNKTNFIQLFRAEEDETPIRENLSHRSCICPPLALVPTHLSTCHHHMHMSNLCTTTCVEHMHDTKISVNNVQGECIHSIAIV